MPGSCSSNALNGCASCGPGLVLFQISASTSESMVGLGCLDGTNPSPKKVYFSKSSQSNYNYNASDNVIDLSTNESFNNSYSENITCFSDKYGIIICTSTISSNASDSGFYKDRYSQGTSFGGSISCSKAARKSSCEAEPETQCKLGGDCAKNPEMGCPGSDSGTCPIEDCNESISCTSHTVNGEESNSIQGGPFNLWAKDNATYNFQAKVASEKDLSFFYGLCQSSVSTKIGLLEANQPQNCAGTTCGEGKDACWGAAGGCFGISDNNLDDPDASSTTAQKLKFKIATIKEGFDETYKSVSGKVKFYIPTEQDIEEGRTPCCNDDFSGTVVKETGYSISAGSTFKNDYLASNAGDFDNSNQSYVGQSICPCITVDSVSFI
jgi:hypothetical protein